MEDVGGPGGAIKPSSLAARSLVRLGQPVVQFVSGIVVLSAGLYNTWLLQVSVRGLHGNDFGKFYYATKQWVAGSSLYAPNVATLMQAGEDSLQFLDMNPPHFHVLLLPFVTMPCHQRHTRGLPRTWSVHWRRHGSRCLNWQSRCSDSTSSRSLRAC